MKRLILLLSILFTILLAIGFYYQQRSKLLPVNESIFSFVSSSTPIVLQLTLDDRLAETFENADNQAYLFTAAYLQEIKTCYRLAKNNQAIKDVIYNNNLLIAFQPQTADHIVSTYILDVSNRPLENIAGFIPSNDSLAKAPAPTDFVDTKIYHARIQADSILHYAKVGNYLIFSFQEQEVQQAIRAHLGIANFQKKQAFVNLFNRYNTKMTGIATIYINYQNFPNFVNTFIKENYFSTFTDFKQLGNFGVFSLDFSKDDWLLKGKLNYDAKNFISVFEGQQASSSYLISFVPNASMGFQDFILSDYSLFRTKLKKYYALNKTYAFNASIATQSKKLKTNIEDLINNCAGVEYLAISTGIDSAQISTDLVMMHLTQVEDFRKKILRINTLAHHAKYQAYKGRAIAKFPIPDFMQMTMGVPFANFQALHYCLLGDRLLLAPTEKQLHWYIDAYNTGNLISSSNRFKTFNANLNAQYNYLYYLPIVGNEKKCAGILNEFTATNFTKPLSWSAYDGLAYQFSFDEQKVNTLFYLSKKLQVPNSLKFLWKYRSSVAAKTAPVILPLAEPLIVFQNDSNQIQILNIAGKLIHTVAIKEALIGEIHALKQAGTYRILFNTANYLYFMDANGKAMPGFPIKLAAATDQTLSLINYQNTNEYRVFINCTNQSIWAYDLAGLPLIGWEGRRFDSIQSPIQQVRINNKDYFFLHDKNGKFYWISRKGETINSPKDSSNSTYNNPFYFVADTAEGKNRFVSTNQNGAITSVYFDGTIQQAKSGLYSKSHLFLQADVYGDSLQEQIYLDQNTLYVFNNQTNLYTYQFSNKISQAAFPLKIDANTEGLGVVSNLNNQFYMFDRRGKLMLDFPIPGNAKPSVYQTKDKAYLFILSKEGVIFTYQTQF